MKTLLARLGTLAAILLLTVQGVGALPATGFAPTLAQAQGAGALDPPRATDASINFDAISRRTAELRGLAPKHDVSRTVLTPEQFRQRMVDDFNSDDSRESVENSRRLMVALGLLEPDVDLFALELDFRTGVVLGQYDPETKQLYVITGAENLGPLERVTFAHEFTHALQDQNYDIRALMPKDSDNSDRDLAVSSLLEGDALITEELFQNHALTRAEREEKRRQERTLGGSLNLDRLPLVILEETYFPYTEGPRFILNVVGQEAVREALQTGNGYGPRVNAIFDRPPTSSAQIIHPEKYIAGVEPIQVDFPDLAAALGDGWKQLRKDLLGEIDHRILIQQFVNRELGDRAAAGWAGDAFALLGRGDEVAVVVSSRWDSPADATEWFDAYGQAIRARYGARLSVVDQRPDRIVWRTPDGLHELTKAGTTTNIYIAQTPDLVARLERALGDATIPAPAVLQPPAPVVPAAAPTVGARP